VTQPGFDNKEQQIIRQRLEERIGKIRVGVEPVDRIERTERGKFRAVVSLLPANKSLEFAGSRCLRGHNQLNPICSDDASAEC
jgi:hypothetical protein